MKKTNDFGMYVNTMEDCLRFINQLNEPIVIRNLRYSILQKIGAPAYFSWINGRKIEEKINGFKLVSKNLWDKNQLISRFGSILSKNFDIEIADPVEKTSVGFD